MIDFPGLFRRLRQRLKTEARRNNSVRRNFYRVRGFIHDLKIKASGRGASDELPNPERMVWIFCTSRSGSSWLRAMLKDLLDAKVWEEPKVGQLFGIVYNRAQEGQLGSKDFILGNPAKSTWRLAVRSFVLETARGSNPSITPNDYLVIKEPDGSTGAPVLLEALPDSRVILLVRDPRDVAASALDGMRRGSWMNEKLDEKNRGEMGRAAKKSDKFLKTRAEIWSRQIGTAKSAVEKHPGPKSIIRYEDLLADTEKTMIELCRDLGLPDSPERIHIVVEKHSWSNVPNYEKGSGKFYRKAKSGGWREDLTPKQARIIREEAGDTMQELYPD